MTKFQQVSLFLAFTLFLSSCTITTTKDPQFVFDTGTILNNLSTLVTCESVNVNGTQTKKSNQTTSELEIDIINGKNIPSNEDSMTSLGRSIASQIKLELKDSGSYNTYKVLFVIKKVDGIVTTTNYTGHVFSSGELN
jgi:hypothetical protein